MRKIRRTVRYAEVQRRLASAPSLAEGLSYLAFDAGDRLFDLEGGRVGVAYELTPMASEASDEATLERHADNLERALTGLPTDYAYQFVLWAAGDADDRFAAYEKVAAGSNGGPWSVLVRAKLERLRHGRHGLVGDGRFRIRRIRVFFTMATPGKGPRALQAGALLGEARNMEAAWEQILGPAGQAWWRAEPTAVCAPAFWALNGQLASEMPLRNGGGFYPGRPLRDRLVQGEVLVGKDSLEAWGHVVQAMSILDLPGSVRPKMINRLLEHYGGEILIALNFRMLSASETRAALRTKNWIAQRRARPGQMGVVNPERKVVADELTEVFTEVESRNKKVVRFGMTAVISTPPEEAETARGRVLKGFGEMGAEAWVEDSIVLPSVLAALPFGFKPSDDEYMRRLRQVLSDRFVSFAPIWGYLDTTRRATEMYVNRVGEPIYLDAFDCDTSMHGAVIATSGAGKSFFVNEKLMQVMRLDPTPYVFILDVGGSYEVLCELVNGDYVRIEKARPTLINPFAGELEVGGEEGGNIHEWVALLAKMSGANMEDEAEANLAEYRLELGLKEAFRARAGNGGAEVTVSDIVRALEGLDAESRRLAQRLKVYTRGNRYGGFFDGQGELKLKKRLVVFDLTELKDMPRLQGAMLLVIFNYIMGLVRRPSMRGVRKYLVIDEAWKFLRDPNAAGFIVEAYKTFRKYDASVWVITQSVLDIAGLGVTGRAILENVANGCLLKQLPTAIPALGTELQLSPSELDVIKTVTTVSGSFSEMFYFTTLGGQRKAGVARLTANPLLIWTATSKAAEKALLRRTIEEMGGDRTKALAYLAEKYPNGLV